MAINYTLDWSDATLKSSFTLIGRTIDDTHTSLALTGKASVKWGEPLQENLLKLLEHFASKGTPPLHPTIGQLWYDATTNRLKLYSVNLVWVEVGS